MRSNVIYFPYISVPETNWMTQMLLYWNQVSSIVPYDYIRNPSALGQYMTSLVHEELVKQLIPGQYVYRIKEFDEKFLCHLNGLGDSVDLRRARLLQRGGSLVHIEKLGNIANILEELRLARPDSSWPWYEVESETANEFMAYLATAISNFDDIDAIPMTSDSGVLVNLSRAGVPDNQINQQLDNLRIQILNNILPIPHNGVLPADLRHFKDRHNNLLIGFRRRIERELVDIAAINDSFLRERRLELFLEESEDQIDQIQAEMKNVGWRIAQGGLAVISSIPGVPQLVGLAGAILGLSPNTANNRNSVDFAYAAQARVRLIS
jgi:hypothetical protein